MKRNKVNKNRSRFTKEDYFWITILLLILFAPNNIALNIAAAIGIAKICTKALERALIVLDAKPRGDKNEKRRSN